MLKVSRSRFFSFYYFLFLNNAWETVEKFKLVNGFLGSLASLPPPYVSDPTRYLIENTLLALGVRP